MKPKKQVHGKSSPAVASAQSKTQAEESASKSRPRARAGRVTIKVLMPQFLRDAIARRIEITGQTRAEFFEEAIREWIEQFDSGDTLVVKGGAR